MICIKSIQSLLIYYAFPVDRNSLAPSAYPLNKCTILLTYCPLTRCLCSPPCRIASSTRWSTTASSSARSPTTTSTDSEDTCESSAWPQWLQRKIFFPIAANCRWYTPQQRLAPPVLRNHVMQQQQFVDWLEISQPLIMTHKVVVFSLRVATLAGPCWMLWLLCLDEHMWRCLWANFSFLPSQPIDFPALRLDSLPVQVSRKRN